MIEKERDEKISEKESYIEWDERKNEYRIEKE